MNFYVSVILIEKGTNHEAQKQVCMMNECFFCNDALSNGQQTVVLGKKGVDTINKIGEFNAEVGQIVHTNCRRVYTRDCCSKPPGKSENANLFTPSTSRRSLLPIFTFKEHCFFCGESAKYDGRKKGFEVIPVRTIEFKDSIHQICRERNDEWANIVLGRIEFASDLHAVDAVYHQQCSINFRTGKYIPKDFNNESNQLMNIKLLHFLK